uniref:Uncharacterized protein n=1 Tax=Klebsiella pneumoniae TaxID=573 RepID=A0A223DQL7_KLEPN|nr:Hypothetical protein [Klebsiella pneumoniae]
MYKLNLSSREHIAANAGTNRRIKSNCVPSCTTRAFPLYVPKLLFFMAGTKCCFLRNKLPLRNLCFQQVCKLYCTIQSKGNLMKLMIFILF